MPLFFPVGCPVFAVTWLGERSANEKRAMIFYAGGGGSVKSGIKNVVMLARVSQNAEGAPLMDTLASLDTEDAIVTVAHADRPRDGRQVQFIAGGMGRKFSVFAVIPRGAGMDVQLLQVSDAITARNAEGDAAEVKSIAFDRSGGDLIATGDGSGVIRIFRLENIDDVVKSLMETPSTPKSLIVTLIKTLTGHQDAINTVQFEPYGKQLCSSSKDGTARVWSLDSGEIISLPATLGLPIAYSKDRKVLKTMCRAAFFSPTDATVIFTLQNAARGISFLSTWKLENDSFQKPIIVPKKVRQICDSPLPYADIAADGSLLVAGDTQGSIIVVDALSLKVLHQYPGHQLPVSCVSIAQINVDSPLARYDIITGSGDKTLIIGSTVPPKKNSAWFWSCLFALLALVCALSIKN